MSRYEKGNVDPNSFMMGKWSLKQAIHMRTARHNDIRTGWLGHNDKSAEESPSLFPWSNQGHPNCLPSFPSYNRSPRKNCLISSSWTLVSRLQNEVPLNPQSDLSLPQCSDRPADGKMLLTLLKQVILGEASLTTMTGPVPSLNIMTAQDWFDPNWLLVFLLYQLSLNPKSLTLSFCCT